VLKRLERTENTIQRQLNDLNDPIAGIPREISSEIFVHCLSPEDEYPALCEILLLLNVCTLWTDIALSTTRIWATLCIDIPRVVTVEFRDIFSRWLSRSRGYPLSLSL
ncbi:hypothetical protein B0H11DRAFT_1629272, partial [Mycena galericulata]